jgi:hypothetical protein
MPTIELTGPEAELLREIAEEWRSDLRVEIGHTDNKDYRDGLKWKETLLGDILERLRAPVAAPSRR